LLYFDGDHVNHPHYSLYHQNPDESPSFVSVYSSRKIFLVGAYLNFHPNPQLHTALVNSDHHALFQEMVNLKLPDLPPDFYVGKSF
jgi:hypothetical protein